MPAELTEQIALITGAGRGIGRATALHLARAGCDVVLVARTRHELDAVAEEAAHCGVRTLVVPMDITDDEQLEAGLRRAVLALGSISILINSAGVAPPRRPVAQSAVSDWDRMLATCLRAPMVLTRLLLPDMLLHQRGAIISIASIAARHARAGEAAYAAAKAGVVAFSRALFAEVRNSGIKVVAVCPGYVDTGFVPPNRRVDRSRFLTPQDVAETVFQTLIAPLGRCTTEVIVEPQFDPEAAT